MLSSPIDEIRSRLDIVDVISGYIKLQKAGANYRAPCPFHSEKKPSFFVSPARQIWHCFGCSKGGDIFGFIKEIEGVEFGDALRILAQKAGVELKRQDQESVRWHTERQRFYEICELACRLFEKQLHESQAGKEAKAYFFGRGLTEESIEKWRLGYSPDTWQGLSDFLVSKGYTREEVEKTGLLIKNEQGSFYDRFRGRIIFPVFDLNSQVVGFGGRVFKEKDKDEVAKYMNTPNTVLYDKSRILYGLDKAKVDIRKNKNCVLVEGYMDAIMSSQSGAANVVATSGTALTPFQLKILKRYTENLTLGFDMDLAGDTATKRGIDLAQGQGFSIRIVRLGDGKDAADITAKDPSGWQTALQNTRSILEFYFESAFANKNPKNPEDKKEISKILLPQIKRIPNHIEKSFWIQKLAKDLEVQEEEVREELKKTKTEAEELGLEPEEIARLPQKSRKELLEERILVLVLKFRQYLDLIQEDIFPFFSLQSQTILVALKKEDPSSLDGETEKYLNYMALKAEVEEFEEKEAAAEFKNCKRELQFLNIKQQLGKISHEIKKAELAQDSALLEELMRQFSQNSQLLKEIELDQPM